MKLKEIEEKIGTPDVHFQNLGGGLSTLVVDTRRHKFFGTSFTFI